ncbi:unnamed protein product [Amoebophrya sp. A120]|nr:unnamed protein product [Amoebophrya sp. A120]|eukprot:GSA120T00024660001.1
MFSNMLKKEKPSLIQQAAANLIAQNPNLTQNHTAGSNDDSHAANYAGDSKWCSNCNSESHNTKDCWYKNGKTNLPTKIPVRVTTRILFARATTSRRVEVRKEKERRVGNTES